MAYEDFHGLLDTIGLVFLFVAFLAVVLFVFRRGAGRRYRDAAQIPFRHEERPASDGDDEAAPRNNDGKA